MSLIQKTNLSSYILTSCLCGISIYFLCEIIRCSNSFFCGHNDFNWASLPFCTHVMILVLVFIFFLINLLLLCWVGYIVAFTNILTIYKKYHAWIHFLYHFPSSSPFLAYDQQIIFPFICMYTQYLHYIHPPSQFPHLLHRPLAPALQAVPALPSVPWFCVRKEEEKNDIFGYLR
jgi:hypothetical protein